MAPTKNPWTKGIYRPLNKDKKEFRLLELLPGRFDSTVRCNLFPADLSGAIPDYETISYCWGDPKFRSTIVLNGIPVDVPQSSAFALRRLRLEHEARIVWIDAICIDQFNSEERGHQVGMMCDVYRNGRCNLIYLGEQDITKAADSVSAILGHARTNGYLDSVRDAEGELRYVEKNLLVGILYDQQALEDFLSNPWFHRLWVVQEAVLSKRNILHSGDTTICLVDVLHVVELLFSLRRFLTVNLGRICYLVIGLSDLVFTNTSYLDFFRVGQERAVTETLDRVYGLLGLMTELDIEPDYDAKPSEVFEQATCRLIQHCDHINHLVHVCHESGNVKACPQISSLPSWVFSFERPWKPQSDPVNLYRGFQASNRRKHESKSGKSQIEIGGLLKTNGLVIGTVREIQDCPEDHLNELEALVASACRDRREKLSSVEEILAMTLCAGVDPQDHPMKVTAAVEQYSVWHSCKQRDIDIPLPKELDETTDADIATASRYDYAACDGCANRAFFTTSNGYVGLGPTFMQAGDIAVVLFGLAWPAILRPVGNQYRFLAVGYVYGIMWGELVREREQQGVEPEIFELI